MSDPRLLTGREPARALRARVRERVASLEAPDAPLTLAIVRAGDDGASVGYARQIRRACERTGIAADEHALPGDSGTAPIVERVRALAADDRVHGILLQLPLPGGVDVRAIAEAIPATKDIDRATPAGLGHLFAGISGAAPATAAAVDALLAHYQIKLEGREVVVIGRSNVVGKPAAMLALRRNATVTICHSRTRDLPSVARRADVLIVAIGRKHFIDQRYVKSNAVVIDAGTNYEGESVYGDVDFEAVAPHVAAITPVPGGVGPLTTYTLLDNLVQLVEQTRSDGRPDR